MVIEWREEPKFRLHGRGKVSINGVVNPIDCVVEEVDKGLILKPLSPISDSWPYKDSIYTIFVPWHEVKRILYERTKDS